MNSVKISYISKGNVYVVNGDSDSDSPSDSSLACTSQKCLRNALQEFGFNVMSFKGPAAFMRETTLSSPAVVLLDTRLRDWSGTTLQSQLIDLRRDIPVVFLGGEADSKEIVSAMKQGAVDFLITPFTSDELCAAIEKAMALDIQNSARHSGELNTRIRLSTLTSREREICFLMVQGYGNTEIAELNGTVAGTVKIHRSRVLSKMGAHNLAALVKLVISSDHMRWHTQK
jgi:two-component system response regulator FixJ